MIAKAMDKDFARIIMIWEASVRATHHFLPEDYLQLIKKLLPDILPAVPVYVHRNKENAITGFLGVEGEKIEMLFIDPVYVGQGIGRELIRFALNELRATKVDVNEHNESATAFYKHIGFEITGRSETDGLGKPFPLLHMEFK